MVRTSDVDVPVSSKESVSPDLPRLIFFRVISSSLVCAGMLICNVCDLSAGNSLSTIGLPIMLGALYSAPSIGNVIC